MVCPGGRAMKETIGDRYLKNHGEARLIFRTAAGAGYTHPPTLSGGTAPDHSLGGASPQSQHSHPEQAGLPWGRMKKPKESTEAEAKRPIPFSI